MKIRIRFQIDEVLNVSEVWPEGDAPKNPTVEDVWKAMGRNFKRAPEGDEALKVIDDWNLADGSSIEVTIE